MSEKRLEGKSVILAVPPNQFREEEVFGPRRILEEEGARVLVASTAVRTCRGMGGDTIESEAAFGDIDAAAYQGIVLAGGSGVPEFFWKDKTLLELVGSLSEAGKVVAAISLSTVVLARAKLLEGRRATVYFLPEAIDELRNAGATYVGGNLVVESNLIMAEGPAAVDAFGDAIVQSLAG